MPNLIILYQNWSISTIDLTDETTLQYVFVVFASSQSKVCRLPAYLTVQMVRFFYKEKESVNAKVLKVGVLVFVVRFNNEWSPVKGLLSRVWKTGMWSEI